MTGSLWWNRSSRLDEPRLRLVCFPYAGGGGSTFRLWQRDAPSDVEVIGVTLPGREARSGEAPILEMEPLIERLSEVVVPFFDRPVAFFGHSAGAVVAWALARSLEDSRNLRIEHLIVAACNAPLGSGPLNDAMHPLDDAGLIAVLKRLGGTPAVVFENAQLLSDLLRLLRADLELVERYIVPADSRLTCPITALMGERDSHTNRAAANRWGELTRGGFALHVVPGGHFFPFTNPSVLHFLLAHAGLG